MRSARIYHFVGDVASATSDLLDVLRELFLQLVPEDVLKPLFEDGADGTPLAKQVENQIVTREVPIALLRAIAAAGDTTWAHSLPVYINMRSWVDTRIEGDDPESAHVVPVRRLVELILTAPVGVDLDTLPPLVETVLKIYGDEMSIAASRGDVPAWDLGGGWRFVSDVLTPKHRYGVEETA